MTQTVWADGIFKNDQWVLFNGEGEPAGDVIIGLADWHSGEWTDHEGRLALAVEASDDMEAVAGALEYFDMVVVSFPSFANGTAFSLARLIRDKYGFDKEIRARGAFIIDQMPLLQRCGVTSFEISSDAVRAGLKRGFWPDLPRYYQHALDENRTVVRHKLRPWLSVPAVDALEAERSAA